MTTPDIQQARKWAKEVSEEYFTYITDDSRAAIKVLQSLPDQWVDAEKVREIYDRYRASEITLHEAFRAAVALTTMPRPEDVPAGEAWIVLCGGKEWVGVRAADQGYVPWGIIQTDGSDYQDVADSEITLISRLVPENKENA